MKPLLPIWLQGTTLALLVSLSIGVFASTLYSQSSPETEQDPALSLLTATPSPTLTATPTPTGATYTITGYVAEMPECSGRMRGATVALLPLGLTTQTDLIPGGNFTFANIPNGAYTLRVAGCNPFGCWRETAINVNSADAFAAICMATAPPTVTPTPVPTFDVQVNVTLPKTIFHMGETTTALVTIDNRSVGCQYPVYNLTLSQQGTPIFRFDSPPVVGPPVFAQTVYTLTAINSGTATLNASAYGERNCGNGWQWTTVNGNSAPVTVAQPLLVTTANDSGPGSLRQLIANAVPGATIRFAAALSGQTITLSSQLNVTKALTIDGSTVAQPITLSGNNAVRVLFVDTNIDVTVKGVIIANGKVVQSIAPPLTPTPTPSGGISTGAGMVNNGHLTLNGVTFIHNLAGGGPGASTASVAPPVPSGSSGALRNNGVVTVTNSTFVGNSAINGYGGAIENYGQMAVQKSTFVENYAFHNGGGFGGAIYNAATLTVNNSTFMTNTTEGVFADPSGAAIYNYNTAILTVNNSTFSYNTLTLADFAIVGSAISNDGTAWVYHSTFHGNSGSTLGATGPTHLYNSIVANSVNGVDCEGTLTTNINNLIQDSSCGATLTGDPKLGPLVNNGGSTQTHQPLAGSSAIDAADSATCLNTDQRGITRPQDGNGDGVARCDIGAVEVSAAESSLIFADGFESGNLNTWSARAIDGGDLSVTRGAALVGRFGLSALLDDNNPLHVTDDRPNGEIGYQVRFRFDPNSLAMAHGDLHALFYGYVGTATQVLKLEMRFAAGQYQVRVAVRNDAAAWTNSAWFVISDAPHLLQLNWRAATAVDANNGRLAFRIDGVLKSNLLGIDNDTRRLDRVRLGALTGIDNGTRGTYFFDAFQANRIGVPSATAAEQEEPAEDTTAFVEAVTAEELADEAAEPPAQQLFLPLVTR